MNFEGRTYSVPFVLCGLPVEVRGCCGQVEVWHQGQRLAEHPLFHGTWLMETETVSLPPPPITPARPRRRPRSGPALISRR